LSKGFLFLVDMEKQCKECGKNKDETLFHKWRSGKSLTCKECFSKAYNKKYFYRKILLKKSVKSEPLKYGVNVNMSLSAIQRMRRIWNAMKNRCENPKNTAYKNYGGRGIKVCDEWQTFSAFVNYMGQRPTTNHSIDRIDVNGNYEPSNCRWATTKQQANNTRKQLVLTVSRLVEQSGSTYSYVYGLIRDGLLDKYIADDGRNKSNPSFELNAVEFVKKSYAEKTKHLMLKDKTALIINKRKIQVLNLI